MLEAGAPPAGEPGYFRFRDAICWGRQGVGAPSARLNGHMVDVSAAVACGEGGVRLPFDLAEVVDNLHYERYPTGADTSIERLSGTSLARTMYYSVRPLLPVSVRKHIQRLSLSGWRRIAFPRWPVDVTVETLMRHALRLVLEQGGVREVPFIWFWPEGAPGCVMMTHDVEGPSGAEFAPRLMDIDDEFRRAVVVPARAGSRSHVGAAGPVPAPGLRGQRPRPQSRRAALPRQGAVRVARRRDQPLRARVREPRVPVGRDVSSPGLVRRVRVLVRHVGAHPRPLRAAAGWLLHGDAALHRQRARAAADDVAGLRAVPLPGGLLDRAVEDAARGHPGQQRPRELHRPPRLPRGAARVRGVPAVADATWTSCATEREVWLAPPAEIDQWWRARQQMRLVPDGEAWRIEGPGSERARVAYAGLDGERLVYQVGRSRLAA